MKEIKRLIPNLKLNFFLFGPRGTGKSTWLSRISKNALIIDLLDEITYRSLLSRPERLVELIEGNPENDTIIIDEVQKIPSLLSIVHSQIEKRKELQFILTGSSSRKLKKQGVDLLAGRAILKFCYPFIASELKENFSLEYALTFGMLPLVFSSENRELTLMTYTSLYLKEEIQLEGIVQNIGNFARFLEIISFSHGQVLNISELARECEIGRKSVSAYISILEDLLIAYRIPIFSKRAKRQLIKHSKFYYFDSGVYRSIRPKGPLDRAEEIAGSALEGLVLQHLKTWNEYGMENNNIYFWRTKAGNEVDFIIYGENNFYAIEVKNSDKIRNKDLNGLKSFINDYPEAAPIILYRGKDKLKIQGILCIPCEFFLLQLIPGKKILPDY